MINDLFNAFYCMDPILWLNSWKMLKKHVPSDVRFFFSFPENIYSAFELIPS